MIHFHFYISSTFTSFLYLTKALICQMPEKEKKIPGLSERPEAHKGLMCKVWRNGFIMMLLLLWSGLILRLESFIWCSGHIRYLVYNHLITHSPALEDECCDCKHYNSVVVVVFL